jgi:TetR/AcrR family transcriptional repressor of bet genes
MPGRKAPEEARREDILRAAYDVAARRGVEALTLRAVAARAGVSHGTVLFHFERRDQLVSTLLDRVLYATATLRIPDGVSQLNRPSERFLALLRVEMDRLSNEPRHFRVFLEYWALGVRNRAIRRKVASALEVYRSGFREFAEAAMGGNQALGSRMGPSGVCAPTPDSLAAAAVSLIHGCALQAVIDPREFDVQRHVEAAVRLLDDVA